MKLDRSLPPLLFSLLAACAGAAPTPVTTAGGEHPAEAATHARLVRADRFHALLPTPVTSFGAAVLGGRLYVAGGYHGVPHHYTAEGQSGEVWSVSLDDGNDWRRHPDLPPSQGLALVAHRTELCAVGGMRVRDDGTMVSIADVRCLDTAAPDAAWAERAPLPAPRSTHDAIVVGDTLWVVGGWALDGDASSGTFATTMLSLDLARSDAAWVEREVPFRRRALAVAEAAHGLVAMAGRRFRRV